jgi:hypothetical protein
LVAETRQHRGGGGGGGDGGGGRWVMVVVVMMMEVIVGMRGREGSGGAAGRPLNGGGSDIKRNE